MSDWERVLDEASGAHYYFNHATQESSWETPEGFAVAATDAVSDAASGAAASAVNDEEVINQPAVTSEWESVYDENSGAYYYANQVTGETSWDVPPGFQEASAALSGKSGDAHTQAAAAASVPLSDEENPDNWQTLWDDSYQLYYYMNSVTQATQWDVPPCLAALNAAAGGSAAGASKSATAGLSTIAEGDESGYAASNQSQASADAKKAAGAKSKRGAVTASALSEGINGANITGSGSGSSSSSSSSSTASSAAGVAKGERQDNSDTTHSQDGSESSGSSHLDGFAFSLLDQADHHQAYGEKHQTHRQKRQSAIVAGLFNSNSSSSSSSRSNGGSTGDSAAGGAGADGAAQKGARMAAAAAQAAAGAADGKVPPDNVPNDAHMEEKSLGSDLNLVPVVDVGQLKPKQSIEDITAVFKNVGFDQFVEKHFRLELTAASGSSGNGPSSSESKKTASTNKSQSASKDKDKDKDGDGATSSLQLISQQAKAHLMSWTSEPAKLSLCIFNNPVIVESAIICNRYILSYMGDRTTSKSPEELVHLLLQEASQHGADRIGDEIYCQIVRQLTSNPSVTSEEKGWHLLMICLACIPPSKYFAPYLIAFCLSRVDKTQGSVAAAGSAGSSSSSTIANPAAFTSNPNRRRGRVLDFETAVGDEGSDSAGGNSVKTMQMHKEFKRLAELCVRYAIKSVKISSLRTHMPTDTELYSLKTGESIVISVHIIGSKELTLPIDSWTTIHDCETRLSSSLNLKESTRGLFCLYEQLCGVRQGEYDEHVLQGHERVADILSFHYIETLALQPRRPPLSRQLDGTRAADATKSAISSPFYRFLFKARWFFDGEPLHASVCNADPVCTKLLYAQAVEEVFALKYPLTRADAILLAAVQAQVALGDLSALRLKKAASSASLQAKGINSTSNDDASNKTKKDSGNASNNSNLIASKRGSSSSTDLMSSALELLGFTGLATEQTLAGQAKFTQAEGSASLGDNAAANQEGSLGAAGGVMDEERKEAAGVGVTKLYGSMHGMTKDQAMIAYLTILRGMPTYGAHYYRLYAQDEQSESQSDMIAAVTCKSMCFIDPRSLSISSELMLPNIASWGYSEGSLMLELVSDLPGTSGSSGSNSSSPSTGHGHAARDVLTMRGGGGAGAGGAHRLGHGHGHGETHKRYFWTPCAKDIADLLQVYSANGNYQ